MIEEFLLACMYKICCLVLQSEYTSLSTVARVFAKTGMFLSLHWSPSVFDCFVFVKFVFFIKWHLCKA